jgi:hypothetical protein
MADPGSLMETTRSLADATSLRTGDDRTSADRSLDR